MYRPRLAPLSLAVAAAGLVLSVAVPAFAHVTVNPDTAPQGGYTKLTFRVPNEEDSASTTKVQVFFPASEPLGSALVRPQPGWHFHVTTAKLATPVQTDDGPVTEAVSEISWTADSPAAAIKPGEFAEFDVSAGPLPDKPSMEFKALQTYSDGHVVRWIQSSSPGAAEPEHPAPVLTLTPKSAGAAPSASSNAATAATSLPSSSRATWALGFGIVALLLALAAIGLGLRRR